MTEPSSPSRAVRDAAALTLDADVLAGLSTRLPEVAEATVAAITVEVPGYAGALSGAMGENIRNAVELALGGFLRLASGHDGSDPGTPLRPALEGAYALGRGEARSGRSMDALLAAYRVGARVAWREFAAHAVAAGVPAASTAKFAELVFAYIDELSAASVSGHADELATTGRVRQRYLEQLGRDLLEEAPPGVLAQRAERADWPVPRTLTAVLLPTAQVRGARGQLDPQTLEPPEESAPELDEGTAVLLVPDRDGPARKALLRALAGRDAVVGPAVPWTEVASSYRRARRTRALVPPAATAIDTDEHLAALVLTADPVALADLRSRVLAPLRTLRPAAAEKLAETLRAWLLHQGRRDRVAEQLFVHPQTVRYRMGQLRELFGDRLDDPDSVLELILALHPDSSALIRQF